MNKIVIPNLKGGLGNQMFQIATTYAYAQKHGLDWGVNYNLQHYCIQGHNPNRYKDTLFKNIPEKRVNMENFKTYSEPKFSYTEIPLLDTTHNIVLDGYFQSEKYFSDESVRAYIQNTLFSVPNDVYSKVVSSIQKIKERLGYDSLIGIHVRRGDYKVYSSTHPLCPPSYYKDAIRIIRSKIKDQKMGILLFTDDPNSVFSEFNFEENDNVIFFNGSSELEDLCGLSLCDNLVICNSSFSWWGSYLGNPRYVVAPTKWFGVDGPKDFHDVFRKDWIKLNY